MTRGVVSIIESIEYIERTAHHDQETSQVLSRSESMTRSLDLGGVDMADPQSMETERQRVREVDRMESSV